MNSFKEMFPLARMFPLAVMHTRVNIYVRKLRLLLVLNLLNKPLKKIKRYKLRKILRKLQPNFQHYVKKVEAQTKNGFLITKACTLIKAFIKR